jgi:drug/metabolite transporter (DMT)-like permease
MRSFGAQTTGTVLVILSAIGWSMAGMFTRLVTANSWAILGWRGVFSSLVIVLYLLLRERGEVVRSFRSVGWTGVLAASISTLASVAFICALLFTSVANVVVVYATVPFVTAGLAWILMRERPASTTLLAAGVAVFGVLVMVGGGGARGSFVGIILTVAMTICMGLLTVLSRRTRAVSMIPATCVSAVQLAIIGALATPLLAISRHDVVVLAIFGVVQAASFACYVEGARHLTAARAALLSALDVPLAPAWALLVVGEVPAATSAVGGTIVLAAVLWDIARSSAEAPAST